MRQYVLFVPTLLTFAYSGFPALVRAQDTSWLDTFASEVLAVLNVAVPALSGVALLVFLWGLVVLLTNTSNDQARSNGRRHMVWGVVGLFVLVSVWGLVQIAQVILGVGGGWEPSLPGFR